ncbi:hypothetical protein [Tissierella praeacuta]|uniref:hypothetical protein n=1 Tax=Tissierella praeacuta TaxID=43131 RepID=UPI00135672B5|nr:hypothetical protein [Tissierella praeacuta]
MNCTSKTGRPQVREFDKFSKKINQNNQVNKEERLEIQFELGIVMEQMVDYYD